MTSERETGEREGRDYARNNLSFAPLEFWSMRTEDQHALDLEAYWKEVLVSRTHGLISTESVGGESRNRSLSTDLHKAIRRSCQELKQVAG